MRKTLSVLMFVLGLLVSCTREQTVPEIEMPSTPIMTGTTSWGVVNVSYLKINKEPDNDQHIVTTLRKGDLVMIEAVHSIIKGNTSTLWFSITKDKLKGWVQDSYIDSYPTREQALTASGILLKGGP